MRHFFAAVTLLLALVLTHTAHAGIMLKPNGQDATPLRTKAITAGVTISGQFATTDMELTFQNETAERIEADFIYTVPQGSVVTYFAYWYGEEKVVARVVEKERAALIYKHITSRQRDPALIEMIGKGAFRARIFPIMPNADLKVQMRFVQTLKATPSGARYEFPLRTEPGFKATLENLKIDVTVNRSDDLLKVTDNYSATQEASSSAYHLKIARENEHPTRDFQVDLHYRPRAVRAVLYAAPSGGGDGFFALAITPSRTITAPRFTIKGVRTYQVMPALPKTLPAGKTCTVTGRYHGSGAATLQVAGKAGDLALPTGLPLAFSSAAINNNLASSLWAQLRIEALSASSRHAATVVALSKRFTLPSKYTSWLAIPREEIERYNEEKDYAELSLVGRQIALQIADGNGNSATARRLKAQFRRLARTTNSDSKAALKNSLRSTMRELTAARSAEKFSPRPNRRNVKILNARLARLRRAGVRPGGSSQDERIYLVEEDMRVAGQELAREIAAGHETSGRAKYLRAQLQSLGSSVGWPADWGLQEGLSEQARLLRMQYQRELQLETPDAARIRAIEKRFAAVYHAMGNTDNPLNSTEVKVARKELADAREAIAAARASNATGDLTELQKRGDEAFEQLRLALEPPRYSARGGDPLISIDAPADAQQVVALMPGGTVKQLVLNAASGKWEARFDIPMYAAEGFYVVQIIVVHKDGTRQTMTMRFGVDWTAPRGAAQAKDVGAGAAGAPRKLRLELDADDDTARVTALLPWGERLALDASTVREHRYFALATAPAGWQADQAVVTFFLLDKAHNRTAITVDLRE